MQETTTIEANFDEARQSQLPFVELLINMGYEYISRNDVLKQRRGDTGKFLLKDIALEQLSKINSYTIRDKEYKFSDSDVWEAIEELENIPYEGLIDTSQKIYNMIMPTSGGKTIPVMHGGRKTSYNFKFIDFENSQNNVFHVAVEFEASGKSNIRPDIVCFVNGIPFVVIENKKSGVSIQDALMQFNRNWGPEYCPRLFAYAQLLIGASTNDMKYGVTGSPAKFFTAWKEKGTTEADLEKRVQEYISKKIDLEVYNQMCCDLNGATSKHKQQTSRKTTAQDKSVVALLDPVRLLDLTKHHTIFDGGEKKISRYQQYFAVKKMLDKVEETEQGPAGERRKGGLVWHTQGSGKSLMMVLFVKALIENPRIKNPRVIVVTDRRDLDKQISDTFKACNLKKKVLRMTTSQQLLNKIQEKTLNVVTTLIHKFERARRIKANFVDESKDIFVLVDEAHRTQGGFSHLDMRRIIPNACYIGFTGTPLMKKQKASWVKFGGYIDKYTIDDALTDKIILPLIYEGRYAVVSQNEKQIDKRASWVMGDLNQEQTKQVQQYVTANIIRDNPNIIEEIAHDIEKHYAKEFQGTGLKGQIVAHSKFAAVEFQKYFEKNGKVKTAVIISDENGQVSEEDLRKYEVKKFLDDVNEKYKNLDSYEKNVIDSFKNNEEGIELLIVVDKLLTGFDAPRNTVLYLAKQLRDHNLLQAIARVNRLFENKKGNLQKTTGYVIDYSENARNLNIAMKLFGSFDKEDIEKTLIDTQEKINELQEKYGALHDLFKIIPNKKDSEAYLTHLEDEQQRHLFYDLFNEFTRVFKECLVLRDFVHEFKHIDTYQKELYKFLELKRAAGIRYADRVDLDQYKQALITILDKYVDAERVELLTKQISIADTKAFKNAIDDLGSDKSKAEAIAAQMERTIHESFEADPKFYERFSQKIEDILKKMHEQKLADIEALKQLRLINDDLFDKKDDKLPQKIKSQKGADIFYRNVGPELVKAGVDEGLLVDVVLDIFKIFKSESIVDWHKNAEVKRIIGNKIDDYLYDEVRGKMSVKIDNESIQKLVQDVIRLAEYNYELF